MNRHLRSAILSLAVAATALVPVAASADPYRHRDRFMEERAGRHQFHGERHARRPVARDDGDLGAAIALGIVGLAVGAMIASSASAPEPDLPRRVRRVEPDYFPPAPARNYPARNRDVVYAGETGAFEPWSREWYRACAARYRSFDARSGTFMGYDQRRHFCVID